MLAINAKYLIRKFFLEERIRTLYTTGFLRTDDGNSKSDAAAKLNLLLQSIIKGDSTSSVESDITTKFKKRIVPKVEKPKNLGEKIVAAAKEIAENVKDKPEEVTEAELIHKVLFKNENLQKSVFKATENNKNLSDLLTSMKIEEPIPIKERLPDTEYTRAEQVKMLLERKPRARAPSLATEEKFDLFGSQPLGIFKKKEELQANDENKLTMWEHCRSREMKLSVTHPPSNIYEQMIIWTDRGIFWKFPIDNEQGLEDEKKVSFTEHVFLENHLEGWCPDRGPIRHFMELVCVGLSRNHWLSAKEKKDHIMWYKEYFLEKNELIQELGAGPLKLEEASSDA